KFLCALVGALFSCVVIGHARAATISIVFDATTNTTIPGLTAGTAVSASYLVNLSAPAPYLNAINIQSISIGGITPTVLSNQIGTQDNAIFFNVSLDNAQSPFSGTGFMSFNLGFFGNATQIMTGGGDLSTLDLAALLTVPPVGV